MYWLSQDDVHTGTRCGRLAAGSVGMAPRRDLHRRYPRQYAGASRRFPIGETRKCTDNAVRIHSLDPRYLRASGCQDEQVLHMDLLGLKTSPEACTAEAQFVIETLCSPGVLVWVLSQ